jgi:chemotaxis-related protein WspB
MQFLLFRLGKDAYGIDTRRVLRVLPLLECKSLPHAPAFVAGLMNLRGDNIPVIDLSLLGGNEKSAARFDTRILLVEYHSRQGATHPLGLIVERARDIRHIDPASFRDSGVDSSPAPYLGKVAMENGDILQLVEVDHLLNDAAADILFPARDGE